MRLSSNSIKLNTIVFHARTAYSKIPNNRMEVKSFASKFEVKSMDDLQFLRNMSPKELVYSYCIGFVPLTSRTNGAMRTRRNPKQFRLQRKYVLLSTFHFPKSHTQRQIFFRDTAKASLKGGHGGSGIASFERYKRSKILGMD